ncbi:MAG: cyanophycinase [Thermomicrobiales bacterium]|nr:cyanophycinase [Thermomicrobiales bacterium]
MSNQRYKIETDRHSAQNGGVVRELSAQVASHPARERLLKGPVMPIGGAEERSTSGVILRTFVELAGKADAKIVVIPTASSEPDTGEDYVEVFERIGAASVEIAKIESREDANSDEMVEMLGRASGIFITGGDQARLSKLMVGTRSSETIERCNKVGVVVAGTSAGASILSAHMMSNGESEAPPHKGMVEIVAGFGLLDNVIVDQHFSTRGRIGRLLVTFAANPGLVAFGIDENTALVIHPDGLAKAIGENSVTVVDGRDVYSDYHDRKDGDILTITGSSVHVLAPGRIFDLNRRVILHLKQEQTATSSG